MKHGMYRTPEYSSWKCMKYRCLNPNNSKYYAYGAKGITVYEEWVNDFTAFYRDMGKRPEGMSLDRIDNNGNYEPSNCRWASSKTQMLNRNPRRPRKSESGLLGVKPNGNGFQARITKWGKAHCLGTFSTQEEAHEVFMKAREEYRQGVQKLIRKEA